MRRSVIIGATAMLAAAVACSQTGKSDILTMVVGTYTGEGSEGIYVYKFDQNEGKVVSEGQYPEAAGAYGRAQIKNPSYLEISDDGKFVYGVTEVSDSLASLTAFSFDAETGALTAMNTIPTGGGDPCYVSTDGKIVLTANYGGSLSAFPIAEDGSLKEPQVFQGTLGGPDTLRQITPHVHCAVFSPDDRYIYASDFSADRVVRFDIDEDGTTVKESGWFAPVHPDYGPRHILFGPDGKNVYVIGELSGDVTVFGYEDGNLTQKQCIKADQVDARGAADIHISPDGKFLYASLRLQNDGLAIFKVQEDGTLEYIDYQNTGIHPRNFNITPNGKYLLCACRDTGEIQVYSRDMETGLLTDTGNNIKLSKPVCVRFVK